MLNFVRFWILLSAFLSGTGWILSALHELNFAGYLTTFAIAGFILTWRMGKSKYFDNTHSHCAQIFYAGSNGLRHCFFLLLAIMTLAAGTLYVPNNIDSMRIEFRACFIGWLRENGIGFTPATPG